MKYLILAILLFPVSAMAGASDVYHKIQSDGFNGAKLPHAVLYSTYTQQIAATNAVQLIELKSFTDFHGITQTTPSTFTVVDSGCYEFMFSGIADATASDKAFIEVWMRHNGVPIPDSNTRVQIVTKELQMTVAVSFTLDMAAGDSFNFMTWGSATDLRWIYTAAGTAPARPATPSIIVTVKKVSGIWD